MARYVRGEDLLSPFCLWGTAGNSSPSILERSKYAGKKTRFTIRKENSKSFVLFFGMPSLDGYLKISFQIW